MPKATNKTKSFSVRMKRDIEKRLREYSDKTYIPMSVIIHIALKEYLDKVDPVKTK